MHLAVAASLEEMNETFPGRSSPPPSPAPSLVEGRKAFKRDVRQCKEKWGKQGELEGYVGMMATIQREGNSGDVG